VVTPVGILFFGFDLTPAPFVFAIVMILSIVGFAAVGTLFSAIVSSTKLAGGLLAMMVFPIALPLVIASTQMMLATFRDGHGPGATGIGILIAFDVIFLTVSWLVFEWVLEP
jgi:heme exporter protein B